MHMSFLVASVFNVVTPSFDCAIMLIAAFKSFLWRLSLFHAKKKKGRILKRDEKEKFAKDLPLDCNCLIKWVMKEDARNERAHLFN